MNPFGKSPAPLRERDKARWVCVTKNWEKLKEAYCKNNNTVILGVEGSGKTTLLNMFFTEEFCKQSAQNKKLIFFADLSDTVDGKKLCSYLTRKLLQSARYYLAEAEAAALEAVIRELQSKGESDQEQFVSACEHLYRCGYTLLLVMDRFESFVSSPNISQEQHDVLRGLLDKNIMCCVVATNYDLEETSLPPDIQGSMYLQKFQNKITMSGFSLEDARKFAAARMSATDPILLNEKRIGFLHRLSGGIPLLFEMAASCMYDRLEKYGRVTVMELRADLQDIARPFVYNWCKFFTCAYWEAINGIRTGETDGNVLEKFRFSSTAEVQSTAAKRLAERGFFVEEPQENNCYTFNSLLLQHFAAEGMLPVSSQKKAEAPRHKSYNIFISYKRTDLGEKTRDAEIAKELYDALVRVEGFVPFLDVMEMPYGVGASDFETTIDSALDTARAFVFVCTKGGFLSCPWPKYEWRVYSGECKDGRKTEGSIYGVVEGVHNGDMPMGLRHGVEHFEFSPESVERLILYIKNQMDRDGQP